MQTNLGKKLVYRDRPNKYLNYFYLENLLKKQNYWFKLKYYLLFSILDQLKTISVILCFPTDWLKAHIILLFSKKSNIMIHTVKRLNVILHS